VRPIRIGVQLPEVERDVRWPEYVAMARAAEEVGFDSIWIGDHLLYRGDGRPERAPWDAWTLLAGLAAATERVALGPLVACTAFRRPGLLARTAAAVDELSGGRLVVALGAGWNETEFRAFGIPFDHRVSRFAEAFEIVRRLLAGERVTFVGTYETVEDAVLLPTPSRRPPLMVGAMGGRMLAVALPHVDAWNIWYEWYGNTAEGLAATNRTVDEAARRAGRDRPRSRAAPAPWLRSTAPPATAHSQTACRPWRVRQTASGPACATSPRPAPTRRSWSSTQSPSARSASSARPWPLSTTPSQAGAAAVRAPARHAGPGRLLGDQPLLLHASKVVHAPV
jgi:alkanesulfonate monooxygenase SsuD/methylene tetrahydromethanopterin reductase-like flavin-dependent oxidoreductase (luciferase family)